YGGANPVFSATYSGFRNGETAAALSGTLALATAATPASNVGNYAIVPSGQSSPNYSVTYVNGALGVTPAPLGVAANSATRLYGSSEDRRVGKDSGSRHWETAANRNGTLALPAGATPAGKAGNAD